MKNHFYLALGYALFSFIAIPMAMLGRVRGRTDQWSAWSRSALAFEASMSGRQGPIQPPPVRPAMVPQGGVTDVIVTTVQKADFVPSEACKQATLGEHLLDVYLHADRIDRLLKVPTKPLPWQRSILAYTRVRLKSMFPDQMRRLGLEFTLDAAIAHTRQELQSGKIERACARESAVREETSATNQNLFCTPEKERAVSAPGDPQEAMGNLIKSATGEITYVGENTVRPKGKAAYTTYSVVVHEASGERTTFSGVDLREKAQAMGLATGMRIQISQYRQEFTSDFEGRTRTQHKNVFEITSV